MPFITRVVKDIANTTNTGLSFSRYRHQIVPDQSFLSLQLTLLLDLRTTKPGAQMLSSHLVSSLLRLPLTKAQIEKSVAAHFKSHYQLSIWSYC